MKPEIACSDDRFAALAEALTIYALPAEVDDAVSDFLQQDSESAERFLDWIDREAAKLDAADGGSATRSAWETASDRAIRAHREQLFPSLVFRRAYDALSDACRTAYKSDLEYLRVLHLAASTMESEVEAALEVLLEQGVLPTSEAVRELVAPIDAEVPVLERPEVDLAVYDSLTPSLSAGVGR